jgi:hypothetical protein
VHPLRDTSWNELDQQCVQPAARFVLQPPKITMTLR